MDDRELSFSKSEDEQSEMSNHDFDQDIKPVIKHSQIFHREFYWLTRNFSYNHNNVFHNHRLRRSHYR